MSRKSSSGSAQTAATSLSRGFERWRPTKTGNRQAKAGPTSTDTHLAHSSLHGHYTGSVERGVLAIRRVVPSALTPVPMKNTGRRRKDPTFRCSVSVSEHE